MSTHFGDNITAVILTFNESENIARVLERLNWVNEIVIVDSNSNDDTLDIAAEFEKVRCISHPFENHADQWNFAISETNIGTEWILALDADYILTDDLIAKLKELSPEPDISAYQTAFKYCILGQPLRGTLYPPVKTLFRKSRGRYVQDGHTQRLEVNGNTKSLTELIHHDDRKPLSRWLSAQAKYAALEAHHLHNTPTFKLKTIGFLRKLIFITPWLVPLYCLVIKGGLLDGWRGFYYAMQRGLAETAIGLNLIELYLDGRDHK